MKSYSLSSKTSSRETGPFSNVYKHYIYMHVRFGAFYKVMASNTLKEKSDWVLF